MRNSWYGVALSTLVWVVGFFMLGFTPESSELVQRVESPVVWATLVAWPVMPLSIYADQRWNGDELAWNPTTSLWVLTSFVWFVNILVGTAYCLRRYAAVHRAPPSRQWESLAVGSIAIWLLAFVVDYVVPADAILPVVTDAMAALVAFAWVGLPIGVLLDAVRVRGFTDWNPNTRAYLVGTSIPFVNLVVGGLYLYKRRAAFDSADAGREFSVPEVEVSTDPSVATSPWFRRSAIVFGVYFLLMMLVAVTMPSVMGDGFEILGLVVWIPFGPFFAACVYKDASWRREQGWSVGENWWLYLLSAVIQGAAFWYLVRRASKSNRYLNRERTASITRE